MDVPGLLRVFNAGRSKQSARRLSPLWRHNRLFLCAVAAGIGAEFRRQPRGRMVYGSQGICSAALVLGIVTANCYFNALALTIVFKVVHGFLKRSRVTQLGISTITPDDDDEF